MFPLYNPSIDYMQAFAAAKGKTKNAALLDAKTITLRNRKAANLGD